MIIKNIIYVSNLVRSRISSILLHINQIYCNLIKKKNVLNIAHNQFLAIQFFDSRLVTNVY